MSKRIFALPVLLIAMLGIAIYVQVTSSTLSLPISTGTTVLTILLPLFTAANVVYTPILSRISVSPNIRQILLPALHILQGGLTIIIATLTAQGFVSSPTFDCGVEKSWQRLYSNHDNRALERIQNTFDCCGLRSIKDRAWPQDCSTINNRHTPCRGPWSASMQRTAGLEFAVAILAGIIQLAHLVYLRRRAGRDNADRDFNHFNGRVQEADNERLVEEPYHDSDNEEVGAGQNNSRPSLPAAQDDAPHRVEPSGLGRDEANEWRS